MRIKLTPLVTRLCLLGVISTPAFAATDAAAPDEQQLIEKLSQQTAALQKEVSQLQKQVKYLKTQQHSTTKIQKINTVPDSANVTGGVIPGVSSGKSAPVARLGDEPLY